MNCQQICKISRIFTTHYYEINDSGRSASPNRNPEYDLRKFHFTSIELSIRGFMLLFS